MKWANKTLMVDRKGERRVVRKFLWFPRCFGGHEWRWLEHAEVVQEVKEIDIGGSGEWGNYIYCWVDVGFVHETLNKFSAI